LSFKQLDFKVKGISGAASFVERAPFLVEFEELGRFMVGETVGLAKGEEVVGSRYPAVVRKSPNLWTRKDYLFLYDSSKLAKSKKIIREQ